MKWIDHQDDYFLRNFKGNDNDGDSNGRPADDTVPTDDTDSRPEQSDTRPEQRPTGNEFSFTGTDSGSRGNSGNGNSNNPESPARKHRRGCMRLIWFFLILIAVAATAFYIRYFIPYTSDTLTSGYIVLVEKRGLFFKTFEGEMISESMLADTAKVYSRDFYFSIPDDSLARVVQSYQGTGRRVTVTTQKYYGTLPWRGSQKSIVTAITAD
ncbi:MAG: hypothetical protein HDS01_06370 [Bacteroides sp.]|nr:hypothetical protein [Bacteroides sp.]